MTKRSSSRPSVARQLVANWRAVVFYWDFLLALVLVPSLIFIDTNLASPERTALRDAVASAIGATPTLGIAALTLSIATLTFLSSIARSRLFQSAARSGALTDFATFSWWEGFIAVVAVLTYTLLPLLPPVWDYAVAGLALYVILGLLGLLLRLTHIVYRHAGALAEDDPAQVQPPQ